MTCTLLLRQNSPAPLIMWSVIGLCVGIYLFIQGFRLLQRRRLILDTPISKVRSASLGMVELSGLAAGPYTIVAPITTRACYYYRTLAWEWKQQGKNKQWVKVAAESMHVPFFLDDNTGKVLVDPRGADLDLHRDFQQEFCDGFFTTKEEAPANVTDFLLRHGVATRNKIKVEEYCIKPKNAVFILGTLDENPGLELTDQPIMDEEHNTLGLRAFLGGLQSPDYDRAALAFTMGSSGGSDAKLEEYLAKRVGITTRPPTTTHTQVIRLSPPSGPAKGSEMNQQQKIAAALEKAGISNPAAWAAAAVKPQAAAGISLAVARSASNGSEGFDSHPPVVIIKGKNNPTFIISWRSQRELANSLGWKCALMIWGGPALALASLYVLLEITHLL
jgi:hypothetical protein